MNTLQIDLSTYLQSFLRMSCPGLFLGRGIEVHQRAFRSGSFEGEEFFSGVLRKDLPRVRGSVFSVPLSAEMTSRSEIITPLLFIPDAVYALK
jgi:hypothetical protein